MNSLPILLLPILVIQEVLSTMSLDELINLALTSKRSRRAVAISSNRKYQNKFEIDAYINEDYGVYIKSNQFVWDYRLVASRDRAGRKEFRKSKQLRLYIGNKLEGFKMLFDSIQEISGSQFNNFFLSMDSDHNQNRLIVDYLKTKQENYKRFKLHSVPENEEDIKYLLDNLKFSNFLKIDSVIEEDFQMDLPENVDFLWIVYANFVRLEQLLGLNCGLINLSQTNLTQHDIHVFLKNWMASESNMNLREIKCKFVSGTMNGVLGDIPYEFAGDDFPRWSGIVKIRRNDGKTAGIWLKESLIEMSMQMIVD